MYPAVMPAVFVTLTFTHPCSLSMFASTDESGMVSLAETLSTNNRVLSNVRLNVTP
jgi:hypothetical protein